MVTTILFSEVQILVGVVISDSDLSFQSEIFKIMILRSYIKFMLNFDADSVVPIILFPRGSERSHLSFLTSDLSFWCHKLSRRRRTFVQWSKSHRRILICPDPTTTTTTRFTSLFGDMVKKNTSSHDLSSEICNISSRKKYYRSRFLGTRQKSGYGRLSKRGQRTIWEVLIFSTTLDRTFQLLLRIPPKHTTLSLIHI